MTAPYSQDLRNRVINAVQKEGMSRRAAAERFGVSESAAIKWVQRVERTGSREAMGMGGHRPEVLGPHHEFLLAVRAEQPDITLEALSRRLLAERGVKAHTSMLSRYFRRHAITFKKDAGRARAGSPGRKSSPCPMAQLSRVDRSFPSGLHR